MQKNIVTAIITAVCAVGIASVSVGYMIKEGIINTDNLFLNPENSDTSASESSVNNKEYNGYTLYRNAYLREGAECYVNCGLEINEICPIYVKLNSMSISKELPDVDLRDHWYAEMDENGTITNEYSYVTCNVTIRNDGETGFETTLNCLWLYFGVDGFYTEARAYNSNKSEEEINQRDYFHITFEPGVEYNFNIAYIAEDDRLEEYKSDLLIFIGFLGKMPEDTYPVIEKQ